MTYVEWGGSAVQIMPWTLINGVGTARQFSEELQQQPTRRISFTSISNAFAFSRRLFRLSPFRSVRRVIDISGDGPNNSGVPAPVARNSTVAQGIIIDRLPIRLSRQDPASIPELAARLAAYMAPGVAPANSYRVSPLSWWRDPLEGGAGWRDRQTPAYRLAV